MYKIDIFQPEQSNIYTILDTINSIAEITSATLRKEEHNIDSMSVELLHSFLMNNYFVIKPFKTLCRVINMKTNKIEFNGRVLTPESDMSDSGSFTHDLVFEGAESFLKDSMQEYSFHFDKNPIDNLKTVINKHNNELKSEPYKHFRVGNVTVEKNVIKNDGEYREEEKYFKSWEDKDTYQTLHEDLKGKYGGTFVFEYTSGPTIIHWLKETGETKDSEIRVGKNIKTIQKKLDASNVITRLKPLGATSETANGDETKLTIAEINKGNPYIDIPNLISLYGIQSGVVDFPDKYTPETLKEAANEWIKEQSKEVARISINLNALDLSLLGLDPEAYDIFNKHRVVCEPLNIDNYLKIIGITIDLMNPQSKEILIGDRELTYADMQLEQTYKHATKIVNNIVPTVINQTVPSIIDKQTGGTNRDVMILNDYKITFEDLKLHQSNLLDEANQLLSSEYLIDKEVRADLLLKVQNIESLSNSIKDIFESIDEKLINTNTLLNLQNKINDFRLSLKSLVTSKEAAKNSLLKRLQTLQSQYTEEKWNDTLEQLVSIADGLERDENGRVTGKIDTTEQINKVLQDVKEDYLKDTVQRTEYTTDKEGIVNKIDETKSEVLKESNQIAQSVSKKVYDNESKTLNQTLSQYINSISTGHQFTYDENGNISSFGIGSSGIKLNGKVIDLNEGDLTIQNGITTIKDAYIDKLFSKQATINYLNSIDITAKRLQAKDNLSSVNIENGSLTLNRSNGTRMDVGIDGIQMFNSSGSVRFSLTPTLVTTSAVGTSVSNVYLGAASTGEARIVDMNGIPGDGAIGSYYYRPLRTLAIKFPLKSNGYIGIDLDELRIMSDGLNDGGYKDVRAAGFIGNTLDVNTYANGTHLYLRPSSGGEVKVTAPNTTETFRPIRASAFNNGSYIGFKKDIEHWDYDALSVIKNDLDIMQYRLKDDETQRLRRGVIVGGTSSTPVEFINDDGVDLYEMTSWALRGVQQVALENDKLKSDDEALKNKLSDLENRLKILEDKLNG
ncbi:phage tail spike protein [Macrococcoides caseolyticum]|uniref:phage tail spike protein n=1 Tax=Macrococcoides caseolyticum TaxID=69966 RepID=UPI000C328A0A|nr:phage tail spike protein [Macrococcus caseolyticus]PKE64209.1 hypothetical protein CW683_01145 [Macrococcus caseolyticus]